MSISDEAVSGDMVVLAGLGFGGVLTKSMALRVMQKIWPL